METDKILSLRAIAIRRSMKKGFSFELAEDFASFVVIKMLEGKSNRDLNFQMIDFLRIEFGRTDGKGKKPIQTISFEELNKEIVSDFHISSTCKFLEACKKKKIFGSERIVFLLHLKYGMKLCEVAEILNISSSRVHQIVDLAKSRFK